MNTSDISRRQALARAAYAFGGALSASTVAAVLAGCERPPKSAEWVPRSLSPEQDQLVTALAETIIPETDTPGARAAGVNRFVDAMLTDYYPPEERQRFLEGLARVDEWTRRAHGTAFGELAKEQQHDLVLRMDQEAFARDLPGREELAPAEREPALQEGDVQAGRGTGAGAVSASGAVAVDGEAQVEDPGTGSFYRTLKELTLVGYYTSEVGATLELAVNPMGSWRADIPYEEIGTAWA